MHELGPRTLYLTIPFRSTRQESQSKDLSTNLIESIVLFHCTIVFRTIELPEIWDGCSSLDKIVTLCSVVFLPQLSIQCNILQVLSSTRLGLPFQWWFWIFSCRRHSYMLKSPLHSFFEGHCALYLDFQSRWLPLYSLWAYSIDRATHLHSNVKSATIVTCLPPVSAPKLIFNPFPKVCPYVFKPDSFPTIPHRMTIAFEWTSVWCNKIVSRISASSKMIEWLIAEL